jgi:hypothetical protein
MYDPTLGRFLQRDPVVMEAENNSLYSYARDNPTNAVDPTGHGTTIMEWRNLKYTGYTIGKRVPCTGREVGELAARGGPWLSFTPPWQSAGEETVATPPPDQPLPTEWTERRGVTNTTVRIGACCYEIKLQFEYEEREKPLLAAPAATPFSGAEAVGTEAAATAAPQMIGD